MFRLSSGFLLPNAYVYNIFSCMYFSVTELYRFNYNIKFVC